MALDDPPRRNSYKTISPAEILAEENERLYIDAVRDRAALERMLPQTRDVGTADRMRTWQSTRSPGVVGG